MTLESVSKLIEATPGEGQSLGIPESDCVNTNGGAQTPEPRSGGGLFARIRESRKREGRKAVTKWP
jgi:hypothetical protein